MRKILFFLATICMLSAWAGDSERQIRKVHLDRVFDCSYERTNAVIDTFVYQMQTDMNALFEWAFIGTENQGDSKGKDAVSIVYTGNYYDPIERRAVLYATISVLGVPWFKNREIGSIYTDSIVGGTRYARLDITYSGSLLQTADGQFHTTPIDTAHTQVHFELNVVLGRFFSAFVTNKTWNEVAAWRIELIIDNIKQYAETGKVERVEIKD